ncbi:unnamed protein product [Thlaspi arvense]|uniref:Uncharacterized protein n=1 Tax=Thlaspi arvense TaxID=13288 RepID=A0AAU9RTJ1_THLAR|nr:unnamed protein product [Thlaspi arvense]
MAVRRPAARLRGGGGRGEGWSGDKEVNDFVRLLEEEIDKFTLSLSIKRKSISSDKGISGSS